MSHAAQSTRSRRTVARSLARGLGVVVILEVAAVPIRFVLQVVLARLCGPDAYGTYTVALTWAQMLAIPAGVGLSGVVLRYVPLYKVRGDWPRLAGLIVQSRRITVGAGAVLGLAGLTWVALGGSGSINRMSLVLAFAATPLLALSTLQTETLRGGGNVIGARVMTTVFQPVLVLCAALLAAVLGDGLTGVTALSSLVAATAVAVALQEATLRRTYREVRRGVEVLWATAEWLRVGGQLLVIKLFQMVLNLSDVLIVGVLLDVRSAGFYAVATKTAALGGLVTQAVNMAVPPVIARAYAEDDTKTIQTQLRWSARIAFVPSFMLAVAMAVFAGPILRVFGGSFGAAASALAILAVGRLATAWTGPVGTTLSVTGHQRINVRVYGLAAALQVGLDFLLIPQFGIAGAAIANSAAIVFWNFALYMYVMRCLNVRLWPLPTGAR